MGGAEQGAAATLPHKGDLLAPLHAEAEVVQHQALRAHGVPLLIGFEDVAQVNLRLH